MKKLTQYFYICILVCFLILPIPVFKLVGDRIDTENHENRTLAERPVLSMATFSEFPQNYETFLMDHLPFKSLLVRANGVVDYRLFRSAGSSPYVIIGKEGWLFYKGQQANFEQPEEDYKGENLFTEEELEKIRENMLNARDLLRDRETEFVIMIAPNKERMYSEFMPAAYGEPAQEYRLKQVVEYLRETTDLTVVSPYENLVAYKESHPENPIYYKYDTHWNNLGSYIGARELDAALGLPEEEWLPPVEDVTITEVENGVYDLAEMIGMQNELRDDRVFVLSGYSAHPIETQVIGGGTEYRYHNPAGDGDPRKVFLVGDSFSTMMGIYVASRFNDMYLNSYRYYEPWMLAVEDPDILIYEVVERYIGNMLDYDLSSHIGPQQTAPETTE